MPAGSRQTCFISFDVDDGGGPAVICPTTGYGRLARCPTLRWKWRRRARHRTTWDTSATCTQSWAFQNTGASIRREASYTVSHSRASGWLTANISHTSCMREADGSVRGIQRTAWYRLLLGRRGVRCSRPGNGQDDKQACGGGSARRHSRSAQQGVAGRDRAPAPRTSRRINE